MCETIVYQNTNVNMFNLPKEEKKDGMNTWSQLSEKNILEILPDKFSILEVK